MVLKKSYNNINMSKKITCSTCKKVKKDSEFIKTDNTHFKTCSGCRAYSKKHYKLNKAEILKGKYDKVNCRCGSTISRCNLTNHKRSAKHQRFLSKKAEEKDTEDKYFYTFWESAIDQCTYYYKSKTKTKMIKCYCGQRFYPNQKQYDKHIKTEHHTYFVDILRHSRPYDDEYVLYEKINC